MQLWRKELEVARLHHYYLGPCVARLQFPVLEKLAFGTVGAALLPKKTSLYPLWEAVAHVAR